MKGRKRFASRPSLVSFAGAVCTLAIIASSCSAGPAGPVASPPPPKPVSVTIEPDVERLSEVFIPSEGGSISATSAEGVVFELELPANALVTGALVTMTPVLPIESFAVGDFLGAVALEPDGLRLLEPASLKITTPAVIPISEQAGFAYRGSGEELYRYPFRPGDSMVMSVMHFSGFGAARGTAEDLGDLEGRPPATEEALAAQLSAPILASSRVSGLSIARREIRTPLIEIVGDWYERSIRPSLAQAESEESGARTTIMQALAWNQAVLQLLGADPVDDCALSRAGECTPEDNPFWKEINRSRTSVVKALKNALVGALERCQKNADPSGAVTVFELADDLSVFESPDAGLEEIIKDYDGCARFELDIDAGFSSQTSFGQVELNVVFEKVRIIPSRSQGRTMLAGGGEPVYENWAVEQADGCKIDLAGIVVQQPLRVVNLEIDANVREEREPEKPSPGINLILRPGRVDEQLMRTCPGLSPEPAGIASNYSNYFDASHSSEKSLCDRLNFCIRDWSLVGEAGLVARRPFNQDLPIGGGSLNETTTFELRHVPEF